MCDDAPIVGDVAGNRQRVEGPAPAGGALHLWLRSRSAETQASVTVDLAGCRIGTVIADRAEEFTFSATALAAGGLLRLEWDPATTIVSAAYVFDPRTVKSEGIEVLVTGAESAPPYRTGCYHFRPPFGWMNDPNGFGRFHGLGHLFYQHYPHARRWNAMHWGHAVSDDFVHWRHMPVFLFPPPEVRPGTANNGGAFSGSAIAGEAPDGVRVFYTEHVDGRMPEREVQLLSKSPDGVATGPARPVLSARPEGLGLTLDFRDPYVFKGPDGLWKMVVGSRDRTAGTVLLYETQDPDAEGGWSFVAVLCREERFGMTAAECPCLLPLDGAADDPLTRWALIFGLLTSRDAATGRRNLTHVIVGRFDGKRFDPEFEQELDFATDAYAFQAFVDDQGPIGIAWLANWTDVSKNVDYPSAMILPRRLILADEAILTPPIEAVERLRGDRLDTTSLLAGQMLPIGNGAAEIELHLVAPGTPFTLSVECPGIELAVVQSGEGLEIQYQPEGERPGPRYIAIGARASTLRIFLDAGSIEVFADGGRWTGTKRLKEFAVPTAVGLAASAGAVSEARAFALRLRNAS